MTQAYQIVFKLEWVGVNVWSRDISSVFIQSWNDVVALIRE